MSDVSEGDGQYDIQFPSEVAPPLEDCEPTLTCPHCRSSEVKMHSSLIIQSLGVILLIPAVISVIRQIMYGRLYKCSHCRRRFRLKW